MTSFPTLSKAALFGAAAFALASTASAQVIRCEQFNYADGLLVPQGTWAKHSGNDDLVIASGQAVIQHGAPSEDAHIPFAAVPGKIFFAIDFSVDDLGAPWLGSDTEYFAHFKDASFGYTARFDIVQALGGGDYSVGIASDDSATDAVWASDLVYGTTYRAVAEYDQDTNTAQLWIDPTSSASTHITGDVDGNPGKIVEGFAMRQSDSDMNETLRIDNLMIGQTFDDVLSTTASCGSQIPRYASIPNPAVLSAGNAPHVGSTWNPVISAMGSAADLLVVSFTPGIEVMTPFGTLLCGLTGAIQLPGAAGAAFALPIPASAALVGLPVCAQGAGIGVGIELTNALDVIIGG